MNVSMENFVNNTNDLLDKHATFKKISKYKLKTRLNHGQLQLFKSKSLLKIPYLKNASS